MPWHPSPIICNIRLKLSRFVGEPTQVTPLNTSDMLALKAEKGTGARPWVLRNDGRGGRRGAVSFLTPLNYPSQEYSQECRSWANKITIVRVTSSDPHSKYP